MEQSPSFLVLHGFANHRPTGHWQRWLTGELRATGHLVRYPQLPDPDHPDLSQWLREIETNLHALPPGDRVVICHSLAAITWLHAAGLGTVHASRVLLATPPSREVLAGIGEIAAFAPPTVSAAAVVATSDHPVRLVASDNDPYYAGGAAATYGEPLGLDVDVIPGGAHLDLEAGYGSWPSMLAWCLHPATRLVAR